MAEPVYSYDRPDWMDPADYDPSTPTAGMQLGDQIHNQRMGIATGRELAAAKNVQQGPGQYIGQAQMQQGMSAANRAGLAQSTARGSSGLARRSGMYAAAAGQGKAAQAGGQSVVAERGARDAAYTGALDRQAKYRQMQRDDQTRRYLGGIDLSNTFRQNTARQDIADRENTMQTIGGFLGAGGNAAGGLASSDERGKVTAGRPLGQVDAVNVATMRGIEPLAWRYKDGHAQSMGLTRRAQLGPTAQNLEATPGGASIVYETDNGKMVDTKAAALQLLGQNATQQRIIDDQEARLSKLEGKA